jgi:TonB family protein
MRQWQSDFSLCSPWRASDGACYERELRHDATLEGKVTVEFVVNTDGSVSNARAAENTFSNEAVAACVVSLALGLRFNPGPEGGSVTFQYPFVFSPAE